MLNNNQIRRVSLEELESLATSEEQNTSQPTAVGRRVSLDSLRQDNNTIQSAAYDIPDIARRSMEEMAILEGDESLSRARSAANALVAGAATTIPQMMQTKAVVENFLHKLFFNEPNAFKAFDYHAGALLAKEIAEAFPENPEYQKEFWAGTMARATGAFLPQMAITLGTMGGGATAAFGSNVLYHSTLSSQYYNEAISEGASEEQALSNMFVNMVTNSSLEAIPMARMLKRVNDLTGGSLTRVAKAGFKGTVDEMLTEGLQQTFSNMAAIAIYDSARGILDGVGESMLAGGILGGVAGGSIMALNAKKIDAIKQGNIELLAATDMTIKDIVDTYGDVLGDVSEADLKTFSDLVLSNTLDPEAEIPVTILQESADTPFGTLYTRQTTDPVHSLSDIADVDAILSKGAREGTALDTTSDRAWSDSGDIRLIFPKETGTRKSESTNNFDVTDQSGARPHTVVVDGSAFTNPQKYKHEAHKLAQKYKDVKILYIDENGKVTQMTGEGVVPKYDSEDYGLAFLASQGNMDAYAQIKSKYDLDASANPESVVQEILTESAQQAERSATIVEKGDEVIPIPNGLAVPHTTTRMDNVSNWEKFKIKYLAWYPYEKKLGLLKEYAKNNIEYEMRQSVLNANRLNKAVLDMYGSKEKNIVTAIKKGHVPAGIPAVIDAALRDPNTLQVLPEALRAPVTDMRLQMDRMSKAYMKHGIVTGPLAAKFQEDLGVYMHRTYKLFDPAANWNIKTIPQEDINAALAYIRNRINAQAKAEGQNKSARQIAIEAQHRLHDLLTRTTENNLADLFKTTELTNPDKGDIDVLLKREDIHPVIRKVMGEVTDPVVNYVNTVAKMSNTLETRIMYDRMAQEFAGKLFFTQEEVYGLQNSADYKYKLKTGVKSKLDDMYMHKDLWEAMQTVERGRQSAWLTALYRANAWAKYSKTVLSHTTVARNIFGGAMFLGFNGHFFNPSSLKYVKHSSRMAFSRMSKLDQKGLAEERLNLIRLGIIGKSVRAGELRDAAIMDARFEGDPETANVNFIEGLATGRPAKSLKEKMSKFFRGATEFYQRGDDFIRIWMYQLEKAQLQAADPRITDQDVADIVHEIYQNYDRVGELARKFRRVPLIAPFVSFPAEVARTTIGTAGRIRAELNSDNPKMRQIGYKRLAGAISTFVGVIGMGAASQMLLRITDEEDKAYREFMPEWDKNSVLVYTRAQDGVVKYFNTSYTNPYAYMIDPFFAMINGRPDEDVLDLFLKGMKVAFEPIINPEIFARAIYDVISNTNAYGGEVYNRQDLTVDKIQKSFLHIWDAFEPGTISSFRRAIEPFNDETSKKKPEEELLGLFGLRMITVDVNNSFGYTVRDMRQEIRDARRVYNSVKFRENASVTAIEDAFERSNSQYEAIFNRMYNLRLAAEEAGSSWIELKQIMEDSGLSARDIEAIRTGTFKPFER